mmetsp:Transcript_3495/g.9585  ORF Transcript_3495/g.9585 Transcript_3495/m.9585 type:complete len:419 (+) Transcript_3495:18-1274(+)
MIQEVRRRRLVEVGMARKSATECAAWVGTLRVGANGIALREWRGCAREGRDARCLRAQTNKREERTARCLRARSARTRADASRLRASAADDAAPQKSKAASGILSRAYGIFTEAITVGFPFITAGCSLIAMMYPAQCQAVITPEAIPNALVTLMLSMGLTLSPRELMDAFKRPKPIALCFIGCYVLMPALAFVLSTMFLNSAELRAGFLLLGIISGGQASNLCTYIAKGDTALSVVMTTLTTLAGIVMLPLLSAALLGQLIPVSPRDIALSTLRLVLLPIATGLFLSSRLKSLMRVLEPCLPVVGVLSTALIVLRAVASSSVMIRGAFSSALFPAVASLHIFGGIAGYVASKKSFGLDERTSRTLAIETAFKSPALSYVLAAKHFSSVAAVPSAVSILILAPLAASFAVYLRYRPVSR